MAISHHGSDLNIICSIRKKVIVTIILRFHAWKVNDRSRFHSQTYPSDTQIVRNSLVLFKIYNRCTYNFFKTFVSKSLRGATLKLKEEQLSSTTDTLVEIPNKPLPCALYNFMANFLIHFGTSILKTLKVSSKPLNAITKLKNI